MTQSSPDRPPAPRYYWLLWTIALASLLMNMALTAVLLTSRAQLQTGAASLAAALDDVTLDEMALTIAIDETAPISLTIPYSDTFRVPIRETIFVSTDILFEDVIQVPINTIIPIDTDFIVQVDIPLVGRTGIPIPIVTNIPVNLTVDVPIRRLIPVETEIEIDFWVDVPVQSNIPINTELPVKLNFPVIISLEQLGLDRLLDQLRDALRQLSGVPHAQ